MEQIRSKQATHDAGPDARRTAAAWLLVPLFVSVLVGLVGLKRLDAPFSPAFEGFNAATWARGAQAVSENGWLDARLGGRRGDSSYAHHPPLVQIEASVAGAVFGDHRWAYRTMALLSMLAAVWCCWGWLGALGFSPGPRSLGLLIASGTSLAVGYSVMLNMEIVWMPLAFALLWAWSAAHRENNSDPASSSRLVLTCGVLAAAGSLAAHQGILLAAGLGIAGVVWSHRQGRPTAATDRAILLGAAVGTVGFLVWVIWVTGGTTDLWHTATVRSADGVGWLSFARAQVRHGLDLFGVMGLVALVIGVTLLTAQDRRRRTIALAVVGSTLLYSVVFRQGATIHEYWNAGLLPAVALAGAAIGERLAQVAPRALLAAVVLAAANMVLVSWATPKTILVEDVGRVTHLAASGSHRLYTTERAADWSTYEAGRKVHQVTDCPAVRAVAEARPDAMVIASVHWVNERAPEHAWESLGRVASLREPGAVLVSPQALDDIVCHGY